MRCEIGMYHRYVVSNSQLWQFRLHRIDRSALSSEPSNIKEMQYASSIICVCLTCYYRIR